MITRVVLQRGQADCGIAALAMVLKLPYEDVFAAVAQAERKWAGRRGLYATQVQAAARTLGVKLRKRRQFDKATQDGVLRVSRAAQEGAHWVALIEGLVFDPTDGAVATLGDYLTANDYTARFLLTDD
jgi:ABC-type bacteriocin/lantibiotic exporter with double-glycine peptidase domain